MKIAIKNPAPRGVNLERWGDYHFGKSLEAALVRQGAEVVQHFWPDWDLHEGEDAAIWLRGKRSCTPRPGIANAIWILSHPGSVTRAELSGFDVVYAASGRLATELQEMDVQGVELMRQCTDAGLFNPHQARGDDDRRGLLFVASSRGVRRPILEWALASGLAPTLVGHGWNQVGHGRLARADYIGNSLLPQMYGAARYGMNDHWGDMAYYEMINNRIFDSLACGLPVISDGFPELAEVAGDGVWIVDGPRSFRDAYWAMKLDYAGARQACTALWKRIGPMYTFDARARQILDRLRAGTSGSGPVPPGSGAEGAGPAIADLLERAGGLGNDPARLTRSLLHVFPRRETSGALAATPSLSALSAGLGAGPWNIRLDQGPSELGARRFDVIFVEDADQWEACTRPRELLAALADRLKPGGFIGAADPRFIEPLQDDARMAVVSRTPLILRRTVEHFELMLSSRTPSSPSRS